MRAPWRSFARRFLEAGQPTYFKSSHCFHSCRKFLENRASQIGVAPVTRLPLCSRFYSTMPKMFFYQYDCKKIVYDEYLSAAVKCPRPGSSYLQRSPEEQDEEHDQQLQRRCPSPGAHGAGFVLVSPTLAAFRQLCVDFSFEFRLVCCMIRSREP